MKTAKYGFKAMYQMKLHQRAVDCLDMIVTCDKRIGDAKNMVGRWEEGHWLDMIRIMNSRYSLEANVLKYELIKQRLTKWYCEIMARINDVALEYLDNKKTVSEIY